MVYYAIIKSAGAAIPLACYCWEFKSEFMMNYYYCCEFIFDNVL